MDKKEKFSYAMGMNVASHLLQMPLELDSSVVAQTIKDLMDGAVPKLPNNEYALVMQEIQGLLEEAAQKKASEGSRKNIEEGSAYLKQNAQKPGVKVTASGLQYEVLAEGKGRHPKATETVRVHYEGKLIDGTVFDSSYRRGEPIEFPLNGVIAGWTEGVQLMAEGAKYRFVIPSELAYGAHGAGGTIGPNATLIFEVELIKVL